MKHGMFGTPEYIAWRNMLSRCYHISNNRYEKYGGRGIQVCARWLNSFINFYSDMGYRPKDHQLDRQDNDGNYTPENCHWVTRKESMRNRSNSGQYIIKGITFQTQQEAADYYNIDRKSIARWAKGYKHSRGKWYPPRKDCKFVPKYL